MNPLDIGRGLAIVAVIYGHALAPWVLTAGANFNEAAFLQWKFGASFMMAFFFFLSGLSWREDKPFAHTVRQSLTLVLIALMASAAYDLVRLGVSVAGLAPQLGGQTLTFGAFAAGIGQMVLIGDYYSLSPLWFLVALAGVRVIAAVVVRFKPPVIAAVATGLLVLSALAIDLDWRSFYQLKALGVGFAIFMLGHFARGIYGALCKRPAAACALLLVGFAGAALTFHLNEGCRWDALARCPEDWLGDRFGVAMIHGQIGHAPLFAFTALMGITFATGLSILLARIGGVMARQLESWGALSLNLLVVNALFLHVANVFVDKFIVPRVEPDALFFVALFALTLLANHIAVRAAERPLRILHHGALIAARHIMSAADAVPGALASVQRPDRVSQRND